MLGAITNLPTENSGNRINASNKQQLALDNLIRRELRVGDPRNPEQVAKALLDRYQYDRRAAAINQEALGLPFLRAPQTYAPAAAEHTATSIDLAQAMSDVDKDLRQVTSNNLLKDISAELEGWSDAIRSSMDEGINAARFGIDPHNRDRAFGVRRTLGDYSRLSRLVGTLTPSASHEFRSLAQSIDEVCSVILVMLGESMANNGFAGGRFLLQAPFTEMQTRRDACMSALQNLLSSLQYSNSSNEWPRGIDAYRQLFMALEAQGQGDLRALMTERELGRVMDNLVRRASQGNSEGLRALGSTAQIDLNRVYRLINVGYRLADPESPPLVSFLESLRLFADGFGQSGGSRLLRVARPPIVFYGLYGDEEEETSDRRLVHMTILRGRLAGKLDCLAHCGCDRKSTIRQIVLDKVLYDADRAIDLYAVSQAELDLPEIRASAYSYTIEKTLAASFEPEDGGGVIVDDIKLKRMLTALKVCLRPPNDDEKDLMDWATTKTVYEDKIKQKKGSKFPFADVVYQELCLQHKAEERWESLVGQLAPGCSSDQLLGEGGYLVDIIKKAEGEIEAMAPGVNKICEETFKIPADLATSVHAYVTGREMNGVEPLER